jgi:CelD/BcsL family acetyltransferase involved in cellulose biosynthesis
MTDGPAGRSMTQDPHLATPGSSGLITSVRPATLREWDEAWDGYAAATYFQSREWAEVWSAYTQGRLRPAALHVTFACGETAVLPLSLRSSDDGQILVSSPAGTYGGWMSADLLRPEHSAAMTDYMTAKLGNVYWQTNPFDPSLAVVSLPSTSPNETHVIDLTQEWETIHDAWSSSCRRAERKAQRAGIRVREAASEEDWRDYYAVYEDSLRRWGDRARFRTDWRLFEQLHYLRSANLRLWLATTSEGRVAAGAVMCYAGVHAVYWHGAAMESLLPHRPMNLLFSVIIRETRKAGFQWFDFNPSGGIDGVRRFKEGFGATPLDCPIVSVGG